MAQSIKGTLIIIGGHEDKQDDRVILSEVARRAKGGPLVVVTAATQLPAQVAAEYRAVFAELGVEKLEVLDVRTRDDAHDEMLLKPLEAANAIFFTGGDQLRITSQIGDTPLFRCLHERYRQGATIVGTSAGAAAMPETMLIAGPSDSSPHLDDLRMAPGLGLLPGVVIDSHFAERGRIGRLLGVVAQNPRNLGIGIDEDTAIVVEHRTRFSVLGSGAIYVADGQDISYSSLSEHDREGVLSVHSVRLHVLAQGARFDLETRQPEPPPTKEQDA
jgi:cyanophycinase